MTGIHSLQRLVYEEYRKNGYEEMWRGMDENGLPSLHKRQCITAISSLHVPLRTLSDDAERYRDGYQVESFRLHPNSTVFEKDSKIAELILIVTEVVEAIGAIHSGEDPAKEYADIVIRVLNAATRAGVPDLGAVVEEKHRVNLGRGALHGRTI